jgi:hypothetical protein
MPHPLVLIFLHLKIHIALKAKYLEQVKGLVDKKVIPEVL